MRQIPISEQLKVLFQGTTTKIGAGILVFCFLLSLFTLDSNNLKALHFIGKETPIMGTVTGTIPKDGNTRVLYQYKVDEKNYNGNFYTTDNIYQSGSYIEIEYANGNPKYSRVLGEKASLGFITVGVFLLVSILLISLEFKRNVEMWILINWGKLTRTGIASKERGKKEEYIVIFHYKDQKGDIHELIEKTTHPEEYNQHIAETVLYLPKRPKMAVLTSKVPQEIILYDI